MKNWLFISLLVLAKISNGQSQATVTIIDFVKIKNSKQQEALFFYENNWKVYRDTALRNGYIKSYKLLTTSADSAANFDFILMTEYSDSSQLKFSEERFQQIIKATRPDGPKLLNELKPNDFRQNLFFKRTETIFTSNQTDNKSQK